MVERSSPPPPPPHLPQPRPPAPLIPSATLAARHLPSINPTRYELACYRRWCALQVVGGGWMSDYDVINYTLTPDGLAGLAPGRLGFACCRPDPARITPCLVHGGADDYGWAIQLFLNYRPDADDLHSGRPHTSDQTILRRSGPSLLSENRIRFLPCGSTFRLEESAWKNSAVVHYTNARMNTAGKTPRHRHISLNPALRLL